MMFFSFVLFGQTYVHTTAENIIRKRFTNFTVVNSNGFVLAKTPVKYDTKKRMPTCYFTIDPILLKKELRRFTIHETPSETTASGDWVIAYNKDEDDVFFSKSKFIIDKFNMKWRIIPNPDGEKLIIYSTRVRGKFFYLGIDKEGHYTYTEKPNDGTKWDLIINKN